MTVSTSYSPIDSACNGTTTAFAVAFQFAAPGDLVVELIDTATGAVTLLVEGVDYTRSGDGMAAPSGIVTATAYPAGKTIRRRRATPLTQTLDMVPNVGAPAESQERAWDRGVLIAQEVKERGDRALVAPQGEAGLTIPGVAARLGGKALAFDPATGAAIVITADSFAVTTAVLAARDATLGYRDQALGYRDAAGGFATTASGAATTATTGAATATAAANAAVLASAIAGAYPNSAASYVPRGLMQASVGAITGGSGGTNGTFPISWSSGNFDIAPSGTFTVSGGVLTAVTITGPGLRIGATATVPTPSFAASTGLTGASVVLTAQFLVGAGQGYWVQSADNSQLDRYTNTGGTPAAAAGVGPIPLNTSTLVATERATRLLGAIKAAVRDPSKIKLLVTKDGAKTLKAGTTKAEIDTLAALVGPTLVQAAYTWDGSGGVAGAALRPTEATRGVAMTTQTGFDDLGAILSQTGEFCIDLFFEMPAPTASYASVAAQTADLANIKQGQITRVNGGPQMDPTNMGAYPDIPARWIGCIEATDAYFAQGLYIKGNGAFNNPEGSPLIYISNSAGTSFFKIAFGRQGQIIQYSYDGATQSSTRTVCQDVYTAAQSGPQHIKIEVSSRHTRTWLNGVEISAFPTKTNFTPAHFFINGNSRGNTTVAPVNGWSWTLDALMVTENLDFTERRLASDVLAAFVGTPKQAWSEVVRCTVQDGQSNEYGSLLNTGDPNNPDATSGWAGEIAQDVSNSPSNTFLTQAPLPRVYVASTPDNPWDIGPVCLRVNIYGGPIGTGCYAISGGNTETYEWGLYGQLFTRPENRAHDWAHCSVNYGGFSLGALSASTTPYLYDVRNATLSNTATQARDYSNRVAANMAAFWKSRGQELELFALLRLNGETVAPLPVNPATGSPYTSAQYGLAYQVDTANWLAQLGKLMKVTGDAPLLIKKAVDIGDGTDNVFNYAPYYFGDQVRRLEAVRSTDFRYLYTGEMYARFGRWTHKPTRYKRKFGETLGRLMLDAQEGGDTRCFGVSSVAIVGGKARLYLTEAADVVDTATPNVNGRKVTGGVDTFGLVSSRTITAVDNSHIADTVPYIEVTGATSYATGDRIGITGTANAWSNYRRKRRVYGLYADQDWSTLPSVHKPVVADAAGTAELTPWLAPCSFVFP